LGKVKQTLLNKLVACRVCFRVQISRSVSKCKLPKCKWRRSWNSNFARNNFGFDRKWKGRYLRSHVPHHHAKCHGNRPTHS